MHVMLPHVSATYSLHATRLPGQRICSCPCPARGGPQPRGGTHAVTQRMALLSQIPHRRAHSQAADPQADRTAHPSSALLVSVAGLQFDKADKINNKCLLQIGQVRCLTATSTPHELSQLLKAEQRGLRRTCGLLAPCRVEHSCI